MATLERLIWSAESTATLRGHILSGWDVSRPSVRRAVGLAECKKCPAWVQVDTDPAPNGIAIGGPAVAVGCGES